MGQQRLLCVKGLRNFRIPLSQELKWDAQLGEHALSQFYHKITHRKYSFMLSKSNFVEIE